MEHIRIIEIESTSKNRPCANNNILSKKKCQRLLDTYEEEYFKKILTDVLEINIIELPKLVKSLTNNKRDNKDLNLWLKFILSPDEIGDEDMSENKNIKKAKDVFEKIKQDKAEQDRALRRMMYIMDQQAIQQYGYEQGIEHGIQQGVQQTKLDVAKYNIPINVDTIKEGYPILCA